MRRRQIYTERAAAEQSKAALLIPAAISEPEPKPEVKRGRPFGSKNKNRK